jgi:two-component system, chemotaxis family, chemotaxis protein CheY
MGKDILIIDDCKFTTKVLANVMRELGFSVNSVQSGEEAVGYLETHEPPSLFLVDWVMPGMSGVELVAWLRAQATTHNTPVLMVTGEKDLTKVAQAITSGANEYIMKPFSPEVIREKLQILGIECDK